MRIAVQHPANDVPDVGRTREEPFRVGGTWLTETVLEDVDKYYPDAGFLVVEFDDETDKDSVSWELNDAEVVEGAEDDVDLMFGEPQDEADQDEEREEVEA